MFLIHLLQKSLLGAVGRLKVEVVIDLNRVGLRGELVGDANDDGLGASRAANLLDTGPDGEVLADNGLLGLGAAGGVEPAHHKHLEAGGGPLARGLDAAEGTAVGVPHKAHRPALIASELVGDRRVAAVGRGGIGLDGGGTSAEDGGSKSGDEEEASAHR